MGQRHQIYIKTREGTKGIHHQWLFGRQALKCLINYLTFLEKAEKIEKHRKESYLRGEHCAVGVLASAYSMIVEDGYYHDVHPDLDVECEDPRLGDNNDGITIIDLTEDVPKYCFMNIGHIEGVAGDKLPTFKPLTAKAYVTAYYPHWQKGKAGPSGDTEDAPWLKEVITTLLKALSRYEVLSPKRVKEVFPKMYGAKKVRA